MTYTTNTRWEIEDLPLILEFVIIEDKVCLSPDDVPRPIGEAYDEIGLYTDMDDWSQTL